MHIACNLYWCLRLLPRGIDLHRSHTRCTRSHTIASMRVARKALCVKCHHWHRRDGCQPSTANFNCAGTDPATLLWRQGGLGGRMGSCH